MFLNKIYTFSHIPGKYCDLIYYSHEILYLFSPLMLLLTGQRCDAASACSHFDLRSRVFVHHLTLDLLTCLITLVKGY